MVVLLCHYGYICVLSCHSYVCVIECMVLFLYCLVFCYECDWCVMFLRPWGVTGLAASLQSHRLHAVCLDGCLCKERGWVLDNRDRGEVLDNGSVVL